MYNESKILTINMLITMRIYTHEKFSEYNMQNYAK